MATFTTISSDYKNKSLVQASASNILIDSLNISKNANILDVGCGTGNLTAELAKLTTGKVLGTDRAEGMILEANKELCWFNGNHTF